MTEPAGDNPPPASAGVLRRLGAMLYDALLVVALLMVLTAALLPLTGGEAISRRTAGAFVYGYHAMLLAAIVLFFGLFWTTRGQTLGMLAWRLKLQRADGARITWRTALIRLGGAAVSLLLLGLGYFWIWIDRDGLAWHDRWSDTRVVVVARKKSQKSQKSHESHESHE
jgi:uncharacterized RDD family membrane protein YckC